MNQQSLEYLLHKLVIEIDKIADALLRQHLGLSYKRFHFLIALQTHGTITQHELAVALGYSDPAVSNMVQSLVDEGYIIVKPSKQHARKRLVSLNTKGAHLTTKSGELLSTRFSMIMKKADVDSKLYNELTLRLLQTVEQSKKR